MGKMEVCGIEPDSISDLVVACGAFLLVVLRFHPSGCFHESRFGFLMYHRHIFGKPDCRGIREGRGTWRVGKDSWVTAIEYHERAFPGSAVDAVVVREFSKR